MASTALNTFCGSPFWDYQLTWNTSNPDVTTCFQKTVLVWIPCGFLWCFAPLETYFLVKSVTKDIPWTALNVTKIVIAAILSLLCLVNLGYSAHQSISLEEVVPSVEYYEPFIKLISFVLVVCFIIFGRIRGIQSSGILFLFWTVLVLSELITYRSYIMHGVDDFLGRLHPLSRVDKKLCHFCRNSVALKRNHVNSDNSALLLIMSTVAKSFPFIVFMIYYPLIVVEFFLSCFADEKPQYAEYCFEHEKQSPECSASFLSKLLFWWFNGLIITGWKRPLTNSDLWSLNHDDLSENVVPVFDKYWNEELLKIKMAVKSASYSPRRSTDDVKFTGLEPKNKPSIVKALIKAFGLFFLQGAIFKFFHDVLQFVSPQVLKLLIGFVGSNDPLWKGVFFALLLFIASSVQSIMLSFYFHRMYLVAMRIRTSLISAIYRKALVLSNSAKRKTTVGEIVNLMSVDAQKFIDLMPFLNLLWSAPLQIALALFFLWDVLGPSVLAGFGVMILVIPVNSFIAERSKTLQVKQMKSKDDRVKLMNEILGGIKVLKLYAWEESFQDQVLKIRMKELQRLRKMAYLNSVMSFIWTCAPYLVSLTSFATFVLSDDHNILDAKRAFVALALFQILRFPLSMLPMLISMLVQAAVSVKRLNNFLTNEELEQYVEHDKSDPDVLTIEHGTFAWHREEAMVLKNISLRVPEGSLVAVVGQVGSGKSSLLSALLGDMERIEGRVNTKGSIAYVSQQAWIQNATLRDNILFYHPLQEDKYKKIVEACALNPDFSILPGADMTEIGEKGINLSGGQKQRISLARAVYSNADIYLLDDPLSAVDSHVGKHIFQNVIGPEGVLKKKTRILVTHGITFLPKTDMIVVLKDGIVIESGSYHELLEKKGAFADFLLQYLREDIVEDVDELEDQDIDVVEEIMFKVGSPELSSQLSKGGSDADIPNVDRKAIIRSLSRQLSQISHDGSYSDRSSPQKKSESESKTKLDKREDSPYEGKHPNKNSFTGKIPDKNAILNGSNSENDNRKIIQTETAETGKVKLAVYLQYMKSIGFLWVALISFGYIALQGFAVGSNIWLSAWSNDKANPDGTQNAELRDLRLEVYGTFGIAQGLSVFLGAISLAFGTMRASRLLHQDLLVHIFKSPMSFFETTPLGRIVNRFSKDVDTVDVTIPMTLRSWILCFLNVIATIIVIAMETPIFISVVVPVGILYYFIQKFYVATSRQLKRLESITRSPIYSHFSETLAGVTTIRGYSAQKLFIQDSHKHVDTNQTCYYPSVVANRWLAIRLEFCGNFIILFAALFAVLGKDTLTPGSVGLSVSYALTVTATLNWLVRMTSELETNIVAIERIEEYTTTTTEAPWQLENNKPPKPWPSKGEVIFDKFSTRYREGLDLVLKGISCNINPGEKVGIVGRTGAGKSSLTLCLFRIIEPSGGSIRIDGIDISKIGLHDLRSNITIIPQDPVLFSGTLRMNLDPFNVYSDEEVWTALEHSHLKNFVSGLEAGLSYEVSEGGENLSVGQRQLVCLARALLRKTKVLVLDEATAAVDLETDDLIQSTIRTEFADCTILTIAHRLNTIMDYNKVIVLDKGIIKEFDSPSELVQNRKSVFHSMAKAAGLV